MASTTTKSAARTAAPKKKTRANGATVTIPKAKTRYTHDQLEHLVFIQLENIERYNELLELIKIQNLLIEEINRTVEDRLELFKQKLKLYPYSNGRKRQPTK
jgi:heme oxygenase